MILACASLIVRGMCTTVVPGSALQRSAHLSGRAWGGCVAGWLQGILPAGGGQQMTSSASARLGGRMGGGQWLHWEDLKDLIPLQPKQIPWSQPRRALAPASPSFWPLCLVAMCLTRPLEWGAFHSQIGHVIPSARRPAPWVSGDPDTVCTTSTSGAGGLSCSVDDGPPVPALRAFREGTVLPWFAKYSLSPKSLSIRSSSPDASLLPWAVNQAERERCHDVLEPAAHRPLVWGLVSNCQKHVPRSNLWESARVTSWLSGRDSRIRLRLGKVKPGRHAGGVSSLPKMPAGVALSAG